MKEKPRCNGKWTEARFNSFVKSQLRRATWKWEPTSTVKNEARVERGKYKCNGCGDIVPLTVDKKKNVFVDHIEPIVDPTKGFETWDKFINRLFCEKENLQVLCKACHDKKTAEEKKLAKERNKNNE